MKSLSTKLLLAFLAVAVTGTILSAAFALRSTRAVFNDYLFNQTREDTAARMAEFYEARGSWAGVERLVEFVGHSGPQGRGGDGGRAFALIGPEGLVIVPGLGFRVGEEPPAAVMDASEPIEVGGREVGRLLARRAAFQLPQPALDYLRRTNLALFFGALGASLLALLLGIFLAHRLVRPLQEMTAAARAVARGELGMRVPVRSGDEVGELAGAFNQMNAGLARARDQRRQMTADIAHDLRTPISIISGYAAGLADGVLEPTEETFSVIRDESQRLERLVEDLRLLSLSDAGELSLNLSQVPPAGIVEGAYASYTPQAREKNITLKVEVVGDLPPVLADGDRMAQVMGHLLDNALRHTPEGGEVVLSAETAEGGALIRVCDTGPGISPEELPHIFDRFYRGDSSRRRAEGGSGLGLAIARSLVEGQGGRIWAESRPGQGAELAVFLPSPTSPENGEGGDQGWRDS